MIKWLFKYGAVIFLLNSILLSIESTYGIGNKIFLTLMVVFLFALLINPKQIKNILFHKAFLLEEKPFHLEKIKIWQHLHHHAIFHAFFSISF